MIGTTLAHYRITAALGAGGMGEVWRAEDTKLGREVALKVLPEEFARDPERMARFEREAKVLASLNHPNIATLYGLETAIPSGADSDAGETTFLAMELVEGEDLSERIKRGAIPVDEAIPIALQIAEALEAAHEAGIVHRDLKPANIKLRPDGTVKVLDFGLAKAWDAETGDSSISMSPTLTAHATAAGVIIGTAAYMSPEQAAGIAADRRADIWAFGVVVWEMLTGHKLFEGETLSHVLASVLKDEVDLDELPANTPWKLRELIARCLQKKPKQRLQAVGDARIVLEEQIADPGKAMTSPGVTATAIEVLPRWRRLLPWAAVAVLAVALAAMTLWIFRQTPQVVSAMVPPPEATDFYLNPASPGPVAVSPDGRSLAFSARDEDGEILLYVRRLDASRARALSDTQNAAYPFWSPDSRWIGYFNRTEGTLKKIDTRGGPPITLCSASNGKGGTWNEDGVIVFTPGSNTPLHRVSSAGGDPTVMTEIDDSRHNSHRHPRFLPDGRHLLFLARGATPPESALMIVELEGGTTTEVMALVTQAEYASGHLLFVRERVLMARPFDPGRHEFEGEAVPVAEGILVVQGASLAAFSVSETGVLSFGTGQADVQLQLEWRDRAGRTDGTLGDPTFYRSVNISPDDRMAAATVIDTTIGTEDLWIFDLERGLRSRFTFDPGRDFWPIWSPTADTLYFASDRGGGGYDIYLKKLGGAGELEVVFHSERSLRPSSITPDGSHLLLFGPGDGTGRDISVLALDGKAEEQPFRRTEFNEGDGAFSPDGKWVAYYSDESGEWEVYVTPFPGPGRRWQVSTASGAYPVWRADGREIIYTRMNGELVAARVRSEGESFFVEGEEELFTIRPPENGGPHFSISSDGQRFLVVPTATQPADSLLHLVVNWPTALEARR
jgi:serine/threonine protein kinase